MSKKFNYKAPSIIALTLAGTALTTHHAHASEKTQDQATNKNVLNDDSTIKQSEQIKNDVSNPTTNISGKQIYQDPTVVKEQVNNDSQNYEATLDNLHNNNDSTDSSSANNQLETGRKQIDDSNSTEENKTSQEASNKTASQTNEFDNKLQTASDTNAIQPDDKNVDQTKSSTNEEKQTDNQNSFNFNVQNNNIENNVVGSTQTAQSTDDNSNAGSTEQATSKQVASTTADDSAQKQPTAQSTVVNSDAGSTEQATSKQVASTTADDSAQKQPTAQSTVVNSDVESTEQATSKQVASTTADDSAQKQPTAQSTDVNSNAGSTEQATSKQVASTTADDSTQKQPTAQSTVVNSDAVLTKQATSKPKVTVKTNDIQNTVATAQIKTATPNTTQKQPIATQPTNVSQKDKTTATTGTATFRSASAAPKLRTLTATNTTQKPAVKKEATTIAKTSLPKYTPQVKSSINDYIRSKNYAVPNYEEDIASYLPKYSYRNGKPEGIVMHDTANDNSTIQGEVNYMKNNYNSAFVHAYVDGNRVIETANTDYLAWGAGPAANDRFIHVELVHTHTADDFARSINNYADYAATNLQYYGLKPDSSEYDGQGTVWTHKAVSNYLGGTDHSDPHGYLQSHGYTYDELYDLINEKYLIKTGKVAAWGTTSSSGSTKPSGSNTGNATPTGKLTVSNLTNTQGTVKATNNGLYTSVYDTVGKKNSTINGKTYQLSKKATLGSKSFYLITDNKSKTNLGWMQTGDVTVKKIAASTNNQLTVKSLKNTQGTVKSSNHGVYTTVYDKTTKDGSKYAGKTYQLSKKANLGSKSFYLITDSKSKTNLGWLQTGDITVKEATSAKTSSVAAAKPKTNQTQNVSKVGQTSPSKLGIKASVYDKTTKDGSKYAGKTFNVTKQRKQGNTTYVLIQNSTNATPIGWVDTKHINTRSLSKAAAKKGEYVVKSTNSGLYAMPWGTKSQVLEQSKKLSNKTFTSSKSVFVDKDEYVYGTVNNKTGWIALKDLGIKAKTPIVKKPITKAKPVDYNRAQKQKFDYVVYNKTGYFYDSPTAKTAGSLNQYYSTIFASYEKIVINGVTWYHGKLENGKKVWIKESDLRKELIKYISTGKTLDQAAAKQYGLPFKPQIQRVPGTWNNASLSEIKNAMNTATLSKDKTQKYQFLRLDKSQDISATDLDKLLQGKGILQGQGAAFKEAAKTYNINEVYLISHALLETGNGTSTLANGGDVINNKVNTKAPTKYYNMFGIGAYDSDAVRQGFIRAKQEGWNTVRKAIIGGAKFIANSYIHQGQNTLYKMRWNPSNPGTHQYATDVNWAKHNATRIKGFYDSMGQVGKYFDINTYI
ncbi:glucosaminidase domain-containing protein [Staphylococcus durrellii]|uniref:glucosaminidase domain-containing protein n=1 Tax=Staphylococcus durrellii TaxID=2781773 RepID=UPI00189D2673|nr:glucosaminidase domain-containing protein [Staphylococcus durrellii]MBF7017457.1 glucosaminidase domain-containing protein [Staphylococcus durrellii]